MSTEIIHGYCLKKTQRMQLAFVNRWLFVQ